MSDSRWPIVTREHSCRECGKTDRCTVAPDGRAGHCFRQNKTWRDASGGNGNGHPSGAGYVGAAHRPKPPAAAPDWKTEAERLREATTEERMAALADATGVSAAAWSLLSPGWATADELREIRANGKDWKENPPAGAFVFPERDGGGQIVGLSLRATDGRKGSPAGAKRGLTVPSDLHQRPDPVLIVEGASDVAACCALGLAAVGRPSNLAGAEAAAGMLDSRTVLVVGERDGKPGGAWPGRDGAKAVAQKIAGRWGEAVRWTLPPLEAKDVRAWLLSRFAAGLNQGDDAAMKAAGLELLAALEAAAKDAKPERRTQADALVDLANRNYRLGMSDDGEAFAVPVDGPGIAMMFRGGGSALRAALAKRYRVATGKTPSASALADALVAMEGMAQDAAPEPVALRLAEHDGGIVLDLGYAAGHAAVVNADGWTVQTVSPVLFRRTALTGALPEPEQAEPSALGELRRLLNVDDDSWPLIIGWLVAAMLPEIPHPVLLLNGEQGVGKSTAARLLIGLVDPSPAPLRSEPRDPEQWAVAASGSWVLCIDNISHISRWLSDAICKAVTGDGLIRRKLYTDSDLAVIAFRRCVVLTSIDAGAMRGDLGDRLLLADLERIPDENRRTEAEMEAAYKALRPRLLGAMLSALSRTLAALPNVTLRTMPRMADFAKVLAALDAACPELTGGRALALFCGQRQRIAGEVIESDPVAVAVVKLVEDNRDWSGTSAELLAVLTPDRPPKGWPTSARGLAGHLRRLRPSLLAVGVRHDPPTQTDKTRTHRIEKTRSQPPEPPEPPESGNSDQKQAIPAGRLPGGCNPSAVQPPNDRPTQNVDLDAVEALYGRSGGSGGQNPLPSTTITDADMDAVVDDLFGDDAPGSSRWPDGRERGER